MSSKIATSILKAAAAAALCVAATIAAGQNAKPGFSVPRLSDGTPDFRGIWQARSTAFVNLEGHPAAKGIVAAKTAVVDPPDGRIPYLQDALKQRDTNFKNRASADPSSNCFQAGVPRASYLPTPFQFIQSPGNLAIVYTDNHAYRIIEPSSTPHDDGIDFFMGDSRGHWEKDTLVVDVTDLGDQTWLDEAGNFHSDQLHVVERYTLLGPDTMRYEARLEDPKIYSRPWTIRLMLHRDKRSGAGIVEDECSEGADGRWHHLSPFDPHAVVHHNYEAELAAAAKNGDSQSKP